MVKSSEVAEARVAAGAPMEIAQAVIKAAEDQSTYLNSLAHSILGSCLLLIVWVVQRSIADNKRTRLGWTGLLVIVILCEAASVLFYYLAAGQLVNIIPDLLAYMPADGKTFNDFAGPLGWGAYAQLLVWQALANGLGLLALIIFALKNAPLLWKAVS